MHCVDPCRLTGLAKRKELNEHVVDRLETLASGRVKVSLLSMGGASMSVPAASLVPIPEVTDLRLSRRDASPAVLRRLLEAALLGAPALVSSATVMVAVVRARPRGRAIPSLGLGQSPMHVLLLTMATYDGSTY